MRRVLVAAIFVAVAGRGSAAKEPGPWGAASSKWHGLDRYEFKVDGRPCQIVAPRHAAPGKPWVWRARFPDYHPEADFVLLSRGFHIAFIDTNGMLGSPRALQHWDAFCDHVISRGLAKRPALEAVSRGGLFAYRWAARHADRVACIYADTPVCDIKSWPGGRGKGIGHQGTWKNLLGQYEFTDAEALAFDGNPIDVLQPLAEAHVPLMHIVSLSDRVVPPLENTFVLADRYRKLGGTIDIIEVAKGTAQSNGHHFDHPDPLRVADFVERYASATPDRAGYFVLRGSLDNCRIKFENEKKGRVAFLGGSITYGGGWRDATMDYLRSRFPATDFQFISAGIPSMGSTPGAFRFTRDVLATGDVDLLFEEAAVNDRTNGRSPNEMTRGMEGIVRHARAENPRIDIVMMHFVEPANMAEYRAGRIPTVIARHEAVAEHHGVPTLQLAREVTERIDAKQFNWENDFKNLHPSPYGHRLYVSAIRRMLSTAWSRPLSPDATVQPHKLADAPLDRFSYDAARLVPVTLKTIQSDGFQMQSKCDPRTGGVGGGTRAGFVNVPMLVGSKPGATLHFPFQGRAVGLFVAAGPDAGAIDHRIDDGPWRSQDLFTQWSGGLHLPWAYVLEAELDGGEHELTVRVSETKNPRSKGHACRIAHFLVNE